MANFGLRKNFWWGLTVFSGVVATTTVLAQTQTEPDSASTTMQPASAGPEEVIVTARRRDERLQDVALAANSPQTGSIDRYTQWWDNPTYDSYTRF